MAEWGRQQLGLQPEGKARLSQVVTTYGPGAMVDLLEHAVVIGGLEFWHYDKKRGVPVLSEPRLRDAVADQLRRRDRELALEDAATELSFADTWSFEAGIRSRFAPGIFGALRLQYGQVSDVLYGASLFPSFEVEMRW